MNKPVLLALAALLPFVPRFAGAQPRQDPPGPEYWQEPPPRNAGPLFPLQMDLSAGVVHRRNLLHPERADVPVGALYAGYAGSMDPGPARTFLGMGVEGTVNGDNGPYQWSVGAGTRLGRAWNLGGSHVRPLSDVHVYTRVTPFFGMRRVAEEDYLGRTPRIEAPGAGVRLGIGFTAPAWSAATGRVIGKADFQSLGNSDADAAAALLVLAAVVLNHGELTWEVYHEHGLPTDTRFGFRLGTGF